MKKRWKNALSSPPSIPHKKIPELSTNSSTTSSTSIRKKTIKYKKCVSSSKIPGRNKSLSDPTPSSTDKNKATRIVTKSTIDCIRIRRIKTKRKRYQDRRAAKPSEITQLPAAKDLEESREATHHRRNQFAPEKKARRPSLVDNFIKKAYK